MLTHDDAIEWMAMKQEIKLLREALAFYADRENWCCSCIHLQTACGSREKPGRSCIFDTFNTYAWEDSDHGWECAENALAGRDFRITPIQEPPDA